MPARQSPKHGWFMFLNPAGWSGKTNLRIIFHNRKTNILNPILSQ